MKIFVLDFETTGVDPKTCRPIEFAGLFYDTLTKERSGAFETLIWSKMDPPIEDEIAELTGITQEIISTEPSMYPGDFMRAVTPMVEKAELLCAYNAPYDREVLYEVFHSFGKKIPPGSETKWFCAMSDFPYPRRLMRCKQLQHRAMDFGLPMDNRKKHRAMADVETVCDIFDLYDMSEVMSYHSIPWVYVTADIVKPWKDNGKQRDEAKAMGFGWEQPPGCDRKFPGSWVGRFKQGQVPEEFPFKTEVFL